MSSDDHAKTNLRPDIGTDEGKDTRSGSSVPQNNPADKDVARQLNKGDQPRYPAKRLQTKDGIDNSDLRALLEMAIKKASSKE
jgi:hypothetical protein